MNPEQPGQNTTVTPGEDHLLTVVLDNDVGVVVRR